METRRIPRITSAERLDGGVAVTFEDGNSALYSAHLLFDTFPQAEELFEQLEESDRP